MLLPKFYIYLFELLRAWDNNFICQINMVHRENAFKKKGVNSAEISGSLGSLGGRLFMYHFAKIKNTQIDACVHYNDACPYGHIINGKAFTIPKLLCPPKFSGVWEKLFQNLFAWNQTCLYKNIVKVTKCSIFYKKWNNFYIENIFFFKYLN